MLLISCESSPLEVTGAYQEVNRNFLERVWLVDLNNTVYPIEENLKINADSTFTLIACTIQTGTWAINADSLVLAFETNDRTADSLDDKKYKNHTILPKQPYKFAIYKDYLLRKSPITIHGKRRILVQKKIKINA